MSKPATALHTVTERSARHNVHLIDRLHSRGDADDDAGIDHGADDLLLELGGLFHEVGKSGKNQVEHAAGFTGRDHVRIELVERLGVFAHRVRQRPAPFHFIRHPAKDGLEQARALLGFEDLEAAKDGEACVL